MLFTSFGHLGDRAIYRYLAYDMEYNTTNKIWVENYAKPGRAESTLATSRCLLSP